MTLQIAICDDEKKELELLQNLLIEIMEEYAISYHIDQFISGEELLKSDLSFHLIFLDIIMAGKSGIEIASTIYKKNRSIRIIFQTNHGEYCKEAMNRCHAFAFLEKPLNKCDVKEQIKDFIENREQLEILQVEFKNVRFLISGEEVEREILILPVNSIIYFVYMKAQKRIKIVTEEGDFTYKETMQALEKRMQSFGFEVSCRGILVNISKIMKIKRYSIIMSNGENIALSQKRVAEFKEKINEYINIIL